MKEIKSDTRHVTADGRTSIGCGLQYAIDRNVEADGIAIVSDGGENQSPYFADVYPKYAKKFDREPPVYLYHLEGESDAFTGSMARSIRHQIAQKFSLGTRVDYYSTPNLVQTMRVSRYALADEVLEAPLITVEEAFQKWEKESDEVPVEKEENEHYCMSGHPQHGYARAGKKVTRI